MKIKIRNLIIFVFISCPIKSMEQSGSQEKNEEQEVQSTHFVIKTYFKENPVLCVSGLRALIFSYADDWMVYKTYKTPQINQEIMMCSPRNAVNLKRGYAPVTSLAITKQSHGNHVVTATLQDDSSISWDLITDKYTANKVQGYTGFMQWKNIPKEAAASSACTLYRARLANHGVNATLTMPHSPLPEHSITVEVNRAALLHVMVTEKDKE
jgi:hypothetical protein